MENSVIASVQQFFSRREENADESFIFGKSTGNSRIEAWWSYLKKTFIGVWVSYFKDLIGEGNFDTFDPTQTQILFLWIPSRQTGRSCNSVESA